MTAYVCIWYLPSGVIELAPQAGVEQEHALDAARHASRNGWRSAIIMAEIPDAPPTLDVPVVQSTAFRPFLGNSAPG